METDTLQSSFQSASGISLFSSAHETTVTMVILVILLVILILIKGSETVCFKAGISKDLQKKSKFSINNYFLELVEAQESLKSAFILLKGLVNIIIVVILVSLLENVLFLSEHPVLNLIFVILVIVSVLLLFGEIIPVILANVLPVLFLKIAEWPLIVTEFLLRPVTKFFNNFDHFFSYRNDIRRSTFSMEEITEAIRLSNDPVLEEDKEILEGIVKFGNKDVADVMKPRVDVISLDIKSGFSAVLDVIINSGFSRIPVYSNSFDNIKGVIYIKDILPHSHKGNSFNWQTLIRPPFYVPETKKINSLLGEFQKNKVHFAVVIDEYGGTSGIVTLEDVLEEIVGEIVDEFDEDNQYFSKIDEKTWMFDGKTLLGDFIKVTDSNESDFEEIKGDAETLAGLILELKGAIPQRQEKIYYNQYTFTIEEADKRRIIKIKVEIEKN